MIGIAHLIKPVHIKAFAEQMSRKYDSVVLDPTLQEDVTKAASFLKAMGIVDATAHLKSYSFTLGQLIWFAFNVRDPSDIPGWSLPDQLVTIAHEHGHVADAKKYGFEAFAKDYVLSSQARAVRWEAPMYCITAELYPILYGVDPDPHALVQPLHAYGCTPEEVFSAGEVVRLRQVAIKAGATLSDQARDAIDFLRKSRLLT